MQTLTIGFGGFIVLIIFLGAMLGGNNLWESIRKGMKFVLWIVAIAIIGGILIAIITSPDPI